MTTTTLPAVMSEVTITTVSTRFGRSNPELVKITGLVAELDEEAGMFRMNFSVEGRQTFTWAYATEIEGSDA